MNSRTSLSLLGAVAAALVIAVWPSRSALAADAPALVRYDYVTLRWAGRDNTHLIRPDGTTEMLGNQLKAARKPERVDDRSFYMNLALNALAQEGYELAAMTSDDYVMKRRSVK